MIAEAAPLRPDTPASRRALAAWCLYDWGNSAFPTVIVTFVFAAYFTKAVAADVTAGTAMWGWGLAASGLAIAVLSPVLGAIADRSGRRKPWIGAFSALCILCTALLWFVRPEPGWALWGLVLFAVANTAFEIGMVFYNAMLPSLAPPDRIGRLSGWGWATGYFGGLVCLGLALAVFVLPGIPPFGLDREAAEHVRITAPLAACWFALFCLPLFLFTPDAPSRGIGPAQAVREGIQDLIGTFRNVRRYRTIARFLIARLLYIDGLNTLFAFGGVYAAGTFGMTFEEIMAFGIAMNVTAGLGAAAFAWLDDWLGAKRTILMALAGLIAFGAPLLVVEGKLWFWVLALPLGLFMGPAQAASRSLMGRIAPPEQRTEMYGLFALSGRITAFLGPAVFAATAAAFDSQRAGMATVLVFIAAGGAVLWGLREERPPSPTM
jgi:UMF1 family MFS transporter